MKTIGEILKGRELYSIGPATSVLDAARLMDEKNIGAIAVLDGSRMVGIFSERDALRRVIVKKLDPATTKVADVMTRELLVAEVHESYEAGVARMQSARVRHLIVAEGDRFQGVVSLRDLLQIEVDERDHELKLMSDYLHYVPPYAH